MSVATRNRGAVVACLLIAAVGLFGLYLSVVSLDPLPIDTWWAAQVASSSGELAFNISVFFAEVGTVAGVATCGVIVAALLVVIGERREAAMLLTALIIGAFLSELTKLLVARPRSLDALYVFHGTSYPSGHSMGAAALALGTAVAVSSIHSSGRASVSAGTVRWVWIFAVCWTLAMMISRTALGVHWLSDTLAGTALGIAAVLLSGRMWLRDHRVRSSRRTRR